MPAAPELSATGAVWGVAVAVAIFVLTLALMALWPPLALIPNVLLLVAGVWLMGGEWWNDRYGS